MHEFRCGEDKSVEGIAVIPVHQASAQANLGREGCWRATLLQEKRTQAPDKGNHLGPFSEPDLLGDFKKADRAHQDQLGTRNLRQRRRG
jgi:hypothetical protein